MTAVALPEFDLTRLRHAVDRLDLPDLRHLELDLDGARRDLARFRGEVQDDLAKLDIDLPHVDLARVDLPSLDDLFGRSRRSVTPTGSLVVGGLALLGGLALGALLAFFLNPSKGPKRRRQARRRLGRLKRRVLG